MVKNEATDLEPRFTVQKFRKFINSQKGTTGNQRLGKSLVDFFETYADYKVRQRDITD